MAGTKPRKQNTETPKQEAVFSDTESLQGKVDIQNFADLLSANQGFNQQVGNQLETDFNLLSSNPPGKIKEFVKSNMGLTDQEADEISKLAPETLDLLLRDTALMVSGNSGDTVEGILGRYKIGSNHYVDHNNWQKNAEIEMAEGGMVGNPMDKQMEFAFMEKQPVNLADGGMIDDGATVEPTTGNEVPPGSLKEEVADKIDAKLSVGEMVIPADVVQYYGVAYFEKLRKKAKEGLAEMEAEGRIGGDPEEDELPFSDDELEAEDMEEDGAQRFAEGGLAWNSPQMTGLANTGTEMKTYVGPDGSKLPILFINGQPIQQIPQGYSPEEQANAQQAAFKSIRPGTGMRGEDDGQRPLNTMEAKPINEWGVEDFERYSNSQGIMKMVTALPALLGPGAGLVGLAASKAYQAQGQKALEEIDNRLAMTDLDAQSRERLQAVKDNLSSRDSEGGGLLGGLFGGEGLFGNLTDGDGLLKNLFSGGVKTTSELPADRPAQSTSRPAATARATPSDGVTSSPRPQPRPTSTSSSPTSVTRTSSGNTVSRKADGTKTVSSSTGSFTPKSSGEVNPGGYNSEKESWSAGPMAEGGLVKRRYKKKK